MSCVCPISPLLREEMGYCPISPFFQESERCESGGSESVGKYCPISPFYQQLELEGCGSNFLGKHCSISDEEESLRPDSATHGPCLKRRRDSDMESDNGCDSGFDRRNKKKKMTVKSYLKGFVPIQEQISDNDKEEERPDSPGSAASATHAPSLKRSGDSDMESDDNGADSPKTLVNYFPTYRQYLRSRERERNKNKKVVPGPRPRKKKITPIAPPTLPKDSHHLTKLKDLMLRWGKLEEDQSRIDRDRANLIQEHAQLMASWI